MSQVEKRFGDPSELSRTLQESVSAKERSAFLFERLIARRPGESVQQRAMRYGIMFFAVNASLSIPLTLLVLTFLGKAHQPGFTTYILLLVSIALGGMMFVATLLTQGVERALFSATDRSLLRASFLGVSSCILPGLLPLVLALGMYPFVPDDSILGFDSRTLMGAVPAALMVPWFLVWLAKQISAEKRYCEEWSELQIH